VDCIHLRDDPFCYTFRGLSIVAARLTRNDRLLTNVILRSGATMNLVPSNENP
jgi:hypothetical protein